LRAGCREWIGRLAHDATFRDETRLGGEGAVAARPQAQQGSSFTVLDVGWTQQTNIESAGLERWGDLRPNETRRYVCPLITYEKWKSLHVTLDVYFEVHLVPGYPWRQHKIVSLEAVRDSDGNAQFVPERDITGRVSRSIDPRARRMPDSEPGRRVPWEGGPTPDWDALERRPHAVTGMVLGRSEEEILRDEAAEAVPPLLRRPPDAPPQ
jgi:hypothetical protein